MGHRKSWLTVLAFLALLSSWTIAQEEGSGEASGEGEEPAEGGEEAAEAEEGAEEGDEASGDGGEESDDGGDEDEEEECEVEETDGSGSGDDDVANILALGGESKKCKSKSKDEDDDSDESGSSEELSGADALADAVGATTCDKEGMDEKVAECLGGLEDKVNDLMTAIMGPEGGEGTLEDKITLVLVKKG